MTASQQLFYLFLFDLLIAGCSVDLTPQVTAPADGSSLPGDGAPDAPSVPDENPSVPVEAPGVPDQDAGVPGEEPDAGDLPEVLDDYAGEMPTDPISKTSNAQGTNNDYFYTFWKDTGNSVTMLLPREPAARGDHAGNFVVAWDSGIYSFVGGKGWNPGSSTRTVNYDCDLWSTGESNAYLTLYGWTTEPLVEYYVVDSWGEWRPPGAAPAGQVTTDGGTYDLYRTTRFDAPNITGEHRDFDQYWSVRTTKRSTPTGAATITFANHAAAWAEQGWMLGVHDYQVLATEVFWPKSSGASDCSVW